MDNNTFWTAFVAALPATIAALFAGIAAVISSIRNSRKIARVEKTVNGRMDQLLSASAKAAHAEGVVTGINSVVKTVQVGTVLIVEDEPVAAHVLQSMLQDMGCKTVVVGNLADGLAVLDSGNFDLVFLDLGLPDSTGVVTVQSMASIARIPIIVISADSDADTVQRVAKLGAKDYLVKGTFDVMRLKKTIELALDRRKRDDMAHAGT